MLSGKIALKNNQYYYYLSNAVVLRSQPTTLGMSGTKGKFITSLRSKLYILGHVVIITIILIIIIIINYNYFF